MRPHKIFTRSSSTADDVLHGLGGGRIKARRPSDSPLGGEQRTSARQALARAPEASEPTASLDPAAPRPWRDIIG